LGGALFLQHRLPTRLLGYLLIFTAGLLKFYPLALLMLVIRERSRTCIAIGIVILIIMSSLVYLYYHELLKIGPNIDVGSHFGPMFGARNLPYGLAKGMVHYLGFEYMTSEILFPTLIVFTAVYAVHIAHRADVRQAVATLPKRHMTFLVIGAILIIGCFFAGQSYPYRGIHFLFILPGLLAFSCQPAERRRRLIFTVSCIVVVFLMWEEWLRRAVNYIATNILVSPEIPKIMFWLGRELAWWWLVGFLGGLVITAIWVSNALLNFRALVATVSGRLLRRSRLSQANDTG